MLESQAVYKNRIIVYSALAICSILFMSILPLGHDLHFHMYRIGAMAEELRRTGFSLPIRILSVSFNEYGYAVPIFYGDVLLYIPAILVCMGVKVNLAIRVLIVLILWLAFCVTNYEVKRVTGEENLAFSIAAVYVFSGYFLMNLVIRMAIGEAGAMIFAPMFLASLYGLVYNPQKTDWIHIGLSVVGMILCHNLSTLLFVGVGTVLVAVCWIKSDDKLRIIWDLLKSVALFLGVSASFIFPFFEGLLYEKYQVPSNNEYQYLMFENGSMTLWDFIFPFEIQKIIKSLFGVGINTDEWHPGGLGLAIIPVALITIIKRKDIFENKGETSRKLVTGWILSTILLAIMFIHPLVSELGHYLGFIQFVWRLLEICTVFWSLYVGYLIWGTEKRQSSVWLLIIILVGIYSIGARYAFQAYLNISGMEYIENNSPDVVGKYKMEYSPNDGDNLYLPEGVLLDTYLSRGEIITDESGNIIDSFHREDGILYIDLAGNESKTLELPIYMYKGYAALDTDKNEILDIGISENGLAQVVTLEDTRHVKVCYKGTNIQIISNLISVLSLIILLTIVLKKEKQKKYEEN